MFNNPAIGGVTVETPRVKPASLRREGGHPCIHNLYPVIYNKVVYETIKETRGEAIVWVGLVGLGIHRYPIRWTGDPDSTPQGDGCIA
ncbi:MAG: hypothetical protein AT709_08080 [Caldivirga sp. MG_3]|nr:MAG: hypothetical protein AT709_08080 [Caldivirga sp. MG_3]